jgi:hypothetical protein
MDAIVAATRTPAATATRLMAGTELCRAMSSSVLGQKETDPRGLRGSAGSRKVPDAKIKKATTFVVA